MLYSALCIAPVWPQVHNCGVCECIRVCMLQQEHCLACSLTFLRLDSNPGRSASSNACWQPLAISWTADRKLPDVLLLCVILASTSTTRLLQTRMEHSNCTLAISYISLCDCLRPLLLSPVSPRPPLPLPPLPPLKAKHQGNLLTANVSKTQSVNFATELAVQMACR